MKQACPHATQAAHRRAGGALGHTSMLAAAVRRALDVVLSAQLLVFLAPLYAAIAIAIVIDSGLPVHFRQTRLGRSRRPFTLYKFRTMRREADPLRHQRYVRALIEQGGQNAGSGANGLFKLAVDDRMTRVGRLLRLWSLDELPQLWNVLQGGMSLVGPRPVIPYEVELYPEAYMERFTVKPGITGLWQVTGRNQRTYQEMVRDDIEYARRESLGLYLRILAKTPWTVLTRRGAA